MPPEEELEAAHGVTLVKHTEVVEIENVEYRAVGYHPESTIIARMQDGMLAVAHMSILGTTTIRIPIILIDDFCGVLHGISLDMAPKPEPEEPPLSADLGS